MSKLPHVTLSGDIEGDYVVLAKHANGSLRITPKQQDGIPAVVTMKRTTPACPTQWRGRLDSGQAFYARFRNGHLSVGVGDDPNQAVDNSASAKAMHTEYVGDGPDGAMDFEELQDRLYGLLKFPADLVVEDEDGRGPDRGE